MPQETSKARQEGRASLSTRRSFVAAASLGAVSLYGLWAALGAAPLRFWELGADGEEAMNDGGGGHDGHGGGSGPDADEFRRMAEAFNAQHRLADGSVAVEAAVDEHTMPGMESHAEAGAETQGTPHDGEHASLDVFMVAEKWSFDPSVLRLKTNQPYRFRMMAVDAAHGASIQLGTASHIIRLPTGALVERGLAFTRPGEYLLYCTMYCGEGHQFMSGKIIVS
jgi:plastocyanin